MRVPSGDQLGNPLFDPSSAMKRTSLPSAFMIATSAAGWPGKRKYRPTPKAIKSPAGDHDGENALNPWRANTCRLSDPSGFITSMAVSKTFVPSYVALYASLSPCGENDGKGSVTVSSKSSSLLVFFAHWCGCDAVVILWYTTSRPSLDHDGLRSLAAGVRVIRPSAPRISSTASFDAMPVGGRSFALGSTRRYPTRPSARSCGHNRTPSPDVCTVWAPLATSIDTICVRPFSGSPRCAYQVATGVVS